MTLGSSQPGQTSDSNSLNESHSPRSDGAVGALTPSRAGAVLPPVPGSLPSFFSGFSGVWLTYLIAVVPTAVFMVMDWLSPLSFLLLFDSQVTPWGVFTSLFIPDDVLNKVIPNMAFLLVYSLIFIATNQCCSRDERQARSRVYGGIVIGSAVAANLLWLVATPLESFGASVIVYGSAGTTIGFAFYNMFPSERSNREARNLYFNNGGWVFGLSNEFVFLGSFLLLAFSPSSFLGTFSSVNGFSHGVALLISFLATAAFVVARDTRDRQVGSSRSGTTGQAARRGGILQ